MEQTEEKAKSGKIRSLPPADLVLLGRVFSREMLGCLVPAGIAFGGGCCLCSLMRTSV